MPYVLMQEDVKARKEHICSYCGGIIRNGEIYERLKVKDGDTFYEWKSHMKCKYIVLELNDFIDPGENGIDEDSFYYGCMEFYNSYISKGENDDQKDFDYFVDVVYNILKEYMLVVDYPKYKDFGWRLERR